MKKHILGMVFAAAAVLSALPLAAKEPVEEFLAALRNKEMHEAAEDYLDTLAANPNLTGEFKDRLVYEQAITILDKAGNMFDTGARMKELDRAREKLAAFLKESPQHALAGQTQIKLGTVLLERGKTLVEQAKRPQVTDKPALRKQALDLFKESTTVFDTAGADFEKRWKEMTAPDPKDKEKTALRDQLRNDTVLAWLYSGIATYESAKCHDVGTKEYKETLAAAGNKFKSVFDRARRRFAGLLAGMWQGRCYQENGELKQALGLYDELLAQLDDSSEEFRKLRSKVLRLAMEAWSDKSQAKHEEAIKRGEEWLDKANSHEEASVEGLGIRYYMALNEHLMIERDKAKPDANKNLLDKLEKDLIANSKYVGDHVGEFKKPAKELLGKYRKVDDLPATFAEARDRARELVDVFEAAQSQFDAEQAKGAAANKQTLAQLEAEYKLQGENAIKFSKLALTLAEKEKDTPVEEINGNRYYLAYLYYRTERYYESGIMGEYVAARHPKSPVAQPCANIAMAAYKDAYNESRADERQFDADQLLRIASDDLAYTAWLTLGDIYIRNKDMAKAKECLDKIPASSPKRAEADLGAGRAIWAQYQASVKQDPPAEKPLLDSLMAEAEAKLKAGTEARRKAMAAGEEPDANLLTGELSLIQLFVASSRSDLAVALLEAKNGCLELVGKQHPATLQNPIFPRENYKVALQAYVGAQKVERAEAMMVELEKLVQGPDANKLLVQIYVQLGREIEINLKAEKDPAKKAALQKGFEVFLKQISDKSTTLTQLGWVQQTFFSLGNSEGTSPKAKDYYTQASATVDKILKHPELKPENAIFYKMQSAKAKRKLGDFQAAANLLFEMLADPEKNRILEIQKEMCYTYQEWGDKDKNPNLYQIAIVGFRQAGVDVIWGWAQMSVRVQKDPKQKETFHEARLNLADCRLKQALVPANTKSKKDLLDKALNDVRIVYRLSSEMGGDNWRPRYDRLYKDIQTAAGQPATGLKGLDEEAAKAKAAETTTTTATGGP